MNAIFVIRAMVRRTKAWATVDGCSGPALTLAAQFPDLVQVQPAAIADEIVYGLACDPVVSFLRQPSGDRDRVGRFVAQTLAQISEHRHEWEAFGRMTCPAGWRAVSFVNCP
jgi:hypothetical protein